LLTPNNFVTPIRAQDPASSDIYGGHQIKALTGLRAVGALLVVVYHFHEASTGWFQPFFVHGAGLGIKIFFSLSGYILALTYQSSFRPSGFPRSYFDFIWKRIARIYPLHVFMLILTLLTFPRFSDAATSTVGQLLSNLTLTQAWGFDALSFIGASWSISIEFLFYLMLPLMLLVFTRWIGVAVFFALAAFYAVLTEQMVPISAELLPYFDHRIFIYGTFFVLGVCMFFMTQHRLVRQILDNNVAFLALVTALVCLSYRHTDYKTSLAAMPFTIPALVRCSHKSGIGNYLLSRAPMLWLGELSYSIYLSHQFIHNLVINVEQGIPTKPFYEWGSTYILLFVWCAFCYKVIEVPMRRMLRNAVTGVGTGMVRSANAD
jgi:peptidoglycan/LPS O-acetylase OafA/YrhL